MPTINQDTTPFGIPLRDLNGVKRTNQSGGYGRHRRLFRTVHIESRNRPYGGDSLTLCGRTFRQGAYLFVFRWFNDYRMCKSCHDIAMRTNPQYREAVRRHEARTA